jgi:hypothetical protein
MRLDRQNTRTSRLPADMPIYWYAAPLLGAAAIATAILVAGAVLSPDEPAWSRHQPKPATDAIQLAAAPADRTAASQVAAPAATPR